MIDRALVKRVLTIRSVPPTILVLTALASYVGQISAILQGWPLWAIGLATILPWIPLFALEMVWTYRHYQWLALFYILVITQGGHVVEHIVQMIQIHLLGLTGAGARGVFGQLDIEWVHFIWNTWVLIAVGLLVWRFRRNPWLWLTLAIASWHELEHVYIMSVYLSTGKQGTPGLLASGGVFGSGLGFVRPDLHFLYNMVETTPLVIAFVYQLRRSYDEWLKRAFPGLPEEALIETTSHIQMLRFPAGARIVRQGDVPDRFYILTRGEAVVRMRKDDGPEVDVQTLKPGQYFGEIGLLSLVPRTASVDAKIPIEVLALDRETFQRVVQTSKATAAELASTARQRLGNY